MPQVLLWREAFTGRGNLLALTFLASVFSLGACAAPAADEKRLLLATAKAAFAAGDLAAIGRLGCGPTLSAATRSIIAPPRYLTGVTIAAVDVRSVERSTTNRYFAVWRGAVCALSVCTESIGPTKEMCLQIPVKRSGVRLCLE